MAQIWVSSDSGDAGNGGTEKADAMDTIAGGIALSSDEDVIMIDSVAPYSEGDVDPAGRSVMLYGYNGLVNLNALGHSYAINNTVNMSDNPFLLVNISINGWSVAALKGTGRSNDRFYAFNCIFYQKGALYQPAVPNYVTDGVELHLMQCTLWGIRIGAMGALRNVFAYNSIIRNQVGGTALTGEDYNAASVSGLHGVNGFDSDTFAPPFNSENTTTTDLSLNKVHAQWAKYATEGRNGARIGATATGGHMWCIDPHIGFLYNDYHMALQGNVAIGDWENDTSHWYDSSWNNIIISAANNKCDFNEGAAELTATVANATYTSGASLATALQSSLNTAGAATFTVQYTTNLRFTVTSDGATFELLWNSGSNTAATIGDDIGFDTAADDTGDTVYAGDYGVTTGAVGDGDAESMPAVWDDANKSLKPNILIEPNRTQARVKSPVIDAYGQVTVNAGYVGKTISGTGSVRLLEARAANETFGKDDAAASTTLDWTEITAASAVDFNQTYRYWQYRIILDLDV